MLPSTPREPWKLYKRLMGYLLPHLGLFFISIVSMCFAAFTEPAFAWLMKPLMDQSFHSPQAATQLNQSTSFLRHFFQNTYSVPLAIVILFIIRGISSFINEYTGTWLSTQLVFTLRSALFKRMLRLPVSFFDTHSSGRLASHVISDVNQVSEAGFSVITIIVKDGLTVLGLTAMLVYTDWHLTLICAVLLPIVSIGVRVVNRRLRKITRDWQDQMGELTQTLNESLQAQRLVKLFNGYEHHQKQFESACKAVRYSQLKQITLSSTYTGIVQWLISLALALIIFLASQKTQLTAGDFMSFVTAMLMLFAPVKRLTNVHQSLERGLAAASTVFEFLDSIEEPNTGLLTSPIGGSIEFKNVCFTYPARTTPALNHLTFSIQPGETIGVVGISGSGKSTLLQLLARFYAPTQGTILLDQNPIQEYDLLYVRKNIALVSQDIILFNDTVTANIAYGLSPNEVTEEAVLEAARHAQALSFIQALPNGFNTLLGESGQNLSGGQRQRIAIARALLKNAPILVLDEATSALDSETEAALQKALLPLTAKRTTLIIAHRLTTVQNADRLLIFKEGCLVESGTHTMLLQQQGEYARLWTTLKKEN
ncbi:MAG: lipid A export permease/ATP-binding protein MsbA [Pseudomonadota bacterium]